MKIVKMEGCEQSEGRDKKGGVLVHGGVSVFVYMYVH